MQAPIYEQVFIQAQAGEDGAFPVRFLDPSGETAGATGYLRPATIQEAVAPRPVQYASGETGQVLPTVYVLAAHEPVYPYAGYDCEEVMTGPSIKERLGFAPQPPHRFCEAAIVATPKLNLI